MEEQNLFRGKLVRLAASRPEDAETVARWSEDPVYLRYMDRDPARPLAPEDVVGHSDHNSSGFQSISFRLRTLVDDTLIGFVALFKIEWNNATCLLGIGIGEPQYRGQGYGADALRLILRYAFDELNMYRVGLYVFSYNTQAIRAYEKTGFRREGILRGTILRDGKRSDEIVMGILREEWLATLDRPSSDPA